MTDDAEPLPVALVPEQLTAPRGGVAGLVQYAGPALDSAGLGQINVLVPQTTTGPVKILLNNVQFP